MARSPLGPGAEFDMVRRIVAAAGRASDPPELRTGPGDDAAVLELRPGEKVVLSCDMALEDVHFRRAWLRWETVGWRATAASLSDLAAMAARPLGVLLGAAIPPELDRGVLEELAAGAGACLEAHGGSLLGGDLSRSPGPVVLDVAAAGAAERPVGRDGARPGDELWVTGALGGAAAAAHDWDRGLEPDPRARRAFERPVPRTAEARWLADRSELHALIDLSDGLAGDARHLAAASGVGLEVSLASVPLSEVLAEYADRSAALRRALTGGEDFELLAAVAPGALEGLDGPFERRFGTELTRVGRVEAGEGVAWLDEQGEEVGGIGGGFDHLAPGSG